MGLSSLVSTVKLAPQAAKATAATTGFVCGRFMQSSAQAKFDYIETAGEHFAGQNPRPTNRKSPSMRSSYVIPFAAQGLLYPEFIGELLMGCGLNPATTGGTGVYTHVFKVATRAEAKYLTMLYGVGDGDDKFERKLVDSRVQQIQLQASPKGINCSFSGLAITEAAAAGTETATTEPDDMFVPSAGSATISMGGVSFTGPVRGIQFEVQNAIDPNEQQLWLMERADLPMTYLDLQGQLMALDLDADAYKIHNWGGAAGTSPVAAGVQGAISFTFESANNIPTLEVPYSITMTMPKVELRMQPWRSNAGDIVRYGVQFMMIDDGTTDPVSITLVNGKATY